MDTPGIWAQMNQLMDGSHGHYLLDGHTVVRCFDFLTWAQQYDSGERQVAEDTGTGWRLSTVFLALATVREGQEPALFETALFTPAGVQILARYATWDAAAHGHRVLLGKVPALLAETRAEEP